jgi:hypothetical protein
VAAFDARAALVNGSLGAPSSTIVMIGTIAPIAYYVRLFAIGFARPDRATGPLAAWRPVVTELDLTAVRPWLRTTWDVNRAFTSALIALLLALLALGTSAGAFGGPAAAAEGPPTVGIPNEVVAPVSSGDLPSPEASAGT